MAFRLNALGAACFSLAGSYWLRRRNSSSRAAKAVSRVLGNSDLRGELVDFLDDTSKKALYEALLERMHQMRQAQCMDFSSYSRITHEDLNFARCVGEGVYPEEAKKNITFKGCKFSKEEPESRIQHLANRFLQKMPVSCRRFVQRLSPQFLEWGGAQRTKEVTSERNKKAFLNLIGAMKPSALDLSGVRGLDEPGREGACLICIGLRYEQLIERNGERYNIHPGLKKLNLADFIPEDDIDSESHFWNLLACAIGRFDDLEELNLNGLNPQRIDMTRELKLLAIYRPSLKKISLRGFERLEDSTIRNMVDRLQNLEEIDLSQCTRVSLLSARALAENCPNLKRICLGGCTRITDEQIENLVERFPRIEFAR